MLEFAAVFAIIMIFAVGWTLRMATNARYWRFWWMRRFGYPDIEYTQEKRKVQERLLKKVSWVMTFVFAVVAAGCFYAVVLGLQKKEHIRTDSERAEDDTRRTFQEMRGSK